MADKVVEITLRLDSQFIRLLNTNIGLSGGMAPDHALDPPHVLARVVLAEARGAYAEQTALIIPPEWRGNIDIVPGRRNVYVGGWAEIAGKAVRAAWRGLKDANDWIRDVEEREAAVCPEDVGFDEYIRALQSQLAQVTQERDALREALEPITKNGRVFIYHRNVEKGDYFECLFCKQENRRWHDVPHDTKCLIAIAKAALEQL